MVSLKQVTKLLCIQEKVTYFDYQELQEIQKCLEGLFTILERFSNSEHKWIQLFFNRLANRGITQESVSQIINIVNQHLKKRQNSC